MNWYILDENNIVVNSIVYDGSSPYIPPEGHSLKSSDKVYNIGDTYVS